MLGSGGRAGGLSNMANTALSVSVVSSFKSWALLPALLLPDAAPVTAVQSARLHRLQHRLHCLYRLRRPQAQGG